MIKIQGSFQEASGRLRNWQVILRSERQIRAHTSMCEQTWKCVTTRVLSSQCSCVSVTSFPERSMLEGPAEVLHGTFLSLVSEDEAAKCDIWKVRLGTVNPVDWKGP